MLVTSISFVLNGVNGEKTGESLRLDTGNVKGPSGGIIYNVGKFETRERNV